MFSIRNTKIVKKTLFLLIWNISYGISIPRKNSKKFLEKWDGSSARNNTPARKHPAVQLL